MASSSVSSSPREPPQVGLTGALRNTWKATSNTIRAVVDLGEEGVSLAAGALGDIAAAATGSGSDGPKALTRWRYSPTDGWPIDIRAAPNIDAQRTTNQLKAGDVFYVSDEVSSPDGVLYLRLDDGRGWLFEAKPGVGVLCVRANDEFPVTSDIVPERAGSDSQGSTPRHAAPLAAAPAVQEAAAESSQQAVPRKWALWRRPASQSTASSEANVTPALWQDVQRLQEDLKREREQRRGRVAAFQALDEALRPLRAELSQEPQLFSVVESERSVVEHRLGSVERAYLELQERQHQLLSKRASQDAEVQRYVVEARRAAAADRARCGEERSWARDGPETEALKAAKLDLAEVLSLVDEDRLKRRRELRTLQIEVEAAQAECDRLRQGDVYVAPKGSFLSSMRRLLTVASGKDDPFPHLESKVS